jgi:alkanesulfonate monooxygenase SsuD/methylene tetrahydromethanopterin reductase-like flavin-dependent oxidoreductase (luciferase family)
VRITRKGRNVMPQPKVLFGLGTGAWNGAAVADAGQLLESAVQADRDGLDVLTIADHPYFGDRLDAYATLGVVLGQTSSIAGAVTVTNPSRPAPLLARTLTSLSALSGGRIIFGIGAGGLWDQIANFGVPRRSPGEAVREMEEAINLVRLLSGGGEPVTFDGEFYKVSGIEAAPSPAPPVWTGSGGPKSLAVTGRLADGWVPPRGADWLNPAYRQARPLIDEAAASAGRDPAQVASIFNFGGRITRDPLPATRDGDGRWVGGTVAQWAEELTGAVLEHGAGGFLYRSTDETPPAVALGRWANEVVPAVREAVAKG